ncbi:hypothetical protein FA15DRAFT_661995 [Coprinopsis marcescibilis]|uniref:Uncharacterized protein n=1 Tax=Coprinopsis marcescibilis TaxID=230819 RepID=A0A5C3K9W0_COPMA|nr:hypothetical protein FA15DRAFT_661995 [Coprinopsis marcescibilis]
MDMQGMAIRIGLVSPYPEVESSEWSESSGERPHLKSIRRASKGFRWNEFSAIRWFKEVSNESMTGHNNMTNKWGMGGGRMSISLEVVFVLALRSLCRILDIRQGHRTFNVESRDCSSSTVPLELVGAPSLNSESPMRKRGRADSPTFVVISQVDGRTPRKDPRVQVLWEIENNRAQPKDYLERLKFYKDP